MVEGPDGTIWFTVSTRRWNLEYYLGDVIEHSCTGLLVRRDPDGAVTVLREGLKFANGLILTPDASHLLVAETTGYRISRHWLTGPKAGTAEPLVDNLAGLPDNISLGSDRLVWVSIAAPRNTLLDRLLPRPGLLRVLLWNLPEAVRPKPTPRRLGHGLRPRWPSRPRPARGRRLVRLRDQRRGARRHGGCRKPARRRPRRPRRADRARVSPPGRPDHRGRPRTADGHRRGHRPGP